MNILMEVFKNKQAVAQEEAFMAVSALADQMEKSFIKYMEAFMPVLIQGLSNNEDYQVNYFVLRHAWVWLDGFCREPTPGLQGGYSIM